MNEFIQSFIENYKIDYEYKSAGISDEDISEIEDEIGFTLPDDYRRFLQTYNLPSCDVLICFCGYSFGGSFTTTYSTVEGKYVEADDEDDIVREFSWVNYDTSSKEKLLDSLNDGHKELEGWLRAGYIFLGSYSGYQVFYDVNSEKVYSIHEDDMYESEDYEDPEANKECMEENGFELCDDFTTFLEFVCTGMPYDEDSHEFIEDAE